jgi:hypothetical protein
MVMKLTVCWVGLLAVTVRALGGTQHSSFTPASEHGKVVPVFKLTFDDANFGMAGAEKIAARLGPGATLVPSLEGKGVAPGREGPAVSLSVPPELWPKEGTLAFRFRTSRTLRGSPAQQDSAVILRCPLFVLTLVEQPDAIQLVADLAHDGTMQDKTTLARFARGTIDWSRLDAGKWYHLAISWAANHPENRLEVYLNGATQQEMRPGRAYWHPWRLPGNLEGELELGGTLGQGDRRAAIAVDSVALYPRFMYEDDLAVVLEHRPNFALAGEGRWDHAESLNLEPFRLSLVYETEFDEPLNVIPEAELFEGDRRARLPEGKDWVFESNGASRVWTESGRCVVQTNGSHSVLWNTRIFPENFLLEFGMSPKDSRNGLTIVFFAARGADGGSIFEPSLPQRAGSFRNYTHGQIEAFHCSYWATLQGVLRRTTNLRKNPDFHMPAVGIDRIGGLGPGPHTVRLLKVKNRVQVETRGRIALEYEDDGRTYGPLLKDGHIGLRQMAHSRQVAYTHFRVWRVEGAVTSSATQMR